MDDSLVKNSVLQQHDVVTQRALASYRRGHQNLLRDECRLERIMPRVQKFFLKILNNVNDNSQENLDLSTGYRTLSQCDRAGVNSPNKEDGNVKLNKSKSKENSNLGSKDSELDHRTNSGNTRNGRNFSQTTRRDRTSGSSDSESVQWKLKSNKSFGTVWIEIDGISEPQRLKIRQSALRSAQAIKSSRSRLKSILNRDHVYRNPWISRVLFPILNECISTTQRQGWCEVSRRDVASADREAVQKYTFIRSLSSKSLWLLLYRSGDEAFQRLTGLHKEEEKSIALTPPDVAVEELAKDTNSGFPLFIKKNTDAAKLHSLKSVKQLIKHPCLDKLIGGNVPFFGNISDEFFMDSFSYAQVIFHRLQVSIDDLNQFGVKIRQVWCVPFTIVALEYVYFNAFIKRTITKSQTEDRAVCSSGLNSKDISEKIVSQLKDSLSYFDGNLKKFLCTGDYRKFDQSIPLEFFDIFFDIHNEYLNLNRREKILFDYLRMYYKYAPFVYEGQLCIKRRGVSSGLYCTNYFDTFVNTTLVIAAESISRALSDEDKRDYLKGKRFLGNINMLVERTRYTVRRACFALFAVCGDDLLWVTDFFQNSVMTELCQTMDMTIAFGPPKDIFSDDVFFLGRYWNEKNEPYQTEDYLISHALFRTKKYDKSNVQFSSEEELELFRVLSIYTPFVNGWEYLMKHFGNWPPFMNFLNTEGSFKLLKDWPYDNYVTVDYRDSLRWDNPIFGY